ncbi:MAG TPA: alkane 1-monooxygenase [Rhizomicrobium sp.]|nr:alkane 1-monooxygenase [Rhizomicrobium sp.]
MLRYCGPFLFLFSIPGFYYGLGPAAPLLSVALLLAALVGAEFLSRRGDAPSEADGTGFRVLVWLYIPLQLIAILWGTVVSAHVGAGGFAALAVSLGVTTGVFGVLAAHEAVHSGDPREALLGTALLTGMSYRHFRIAHLYGHHRWAGTEKDAATARLGEGFYRFFLRTLAGQFLEAWRFERRKGSARLTLDLALMLAPFAAITFCLGLRASFFFVCQSAIAVMVLELFNYIAHYGLVRGRDATGKLEALNDCHSWNSSNVLANRLIFNMGRHSHHHRRPTAPYQSLKARRAPELPFGYATSILLALAPPLWRRVMDPKALAWRA